MLTLQDLKFRFPIQSIYQKSNKLIFTCDHGFLAYERGPLSFVVAGDPVLSEIGSYSELMNEFLEFAHKSKKSVCGYYFSEEFKSATQFKFIKAGTSGFLDLTDFTTAGARREPVRRAVNYGMRNNYSFSEISHKKKPDYLEKVKLLEQKWLKAKRRPKVNFILSPINLKYENSASEQWFVSTNEFGHLGSFVSLFPYGDNDYYIDQIIYNPESQRMSLDFLISKVILHLQKQNARSLCFGFNAFKVGDAENAYERTLDFFYKYPWAYNAAGVYSFKSKYFDYEVPRYIMLEQDTASWKQILSMGAVTFMNH